jgi:O-antigen/teichoic acid export membrane protein
MTSDKAIFAFDELKIGDRFRVVWGFVWRGLLTGVASALGGGIAGAILGAVIGFIGHLLGWPMDSIRLGAQILGGFAGAVVGLCLLWQYIRWLFRAKWSGYQLRLVRQDD